MKKLFSVSLAAAMVMSSAAVCFAVDEADNKVASISPDGHLESDNVIKTEVTDMVAYGKTIYYPLIGETGAYVDEYDAVQSMSIKKSWDMNGDAIESVSVVKKKFNGDSTSGEGYYYFLALKAKNASSTAQTDVTGEITLKKTGTNGIVTDDNSTTLEVGVTVGYKYASANDLQLTDTPRIYYFTDTDNENAIPTSDEETLDLYGEAGYFTVSTVGQGKILLANDLDYDSDIAAKYPTANLDFVNGNGANFNKTGEMTIYADEGSYLYEVNSDGLLEEVDAEYDEYEEAFKFKTRTLGRYVISDQELDLDDVVVDDSTDTDSSTDVTDGTETDDTTVINPPSGARA